MLFSLEYRPVGQYFGKSFHGLVGMGDEPVIRRRFKTRRRRRSGSFRDGDLL